MSTIPMMTLAQNVFNSLVDVLPANNQTIKALNDMAKVSETLHGKSSLRILGIANSSRNLGVFFIHGADAHNRNMIIAKTKRSTWKSREPLTSMIFTQARWQIDAQPASCLMCPLSPYSKLLLCAYVRG
jgi:hypothetical protein